MHAHWSTRATRTSPNLPSVAPSVIPSVIPSVPLQLPASAVARVVRPAGAA